MIKSKPMRLLAALVLILTALVLSVNLIGADCIDEADCENQINQQNAQLESIKKQQSDLQKQLDSAKLNLNSTTAQINDLQKQVDDIKAQLVAVEEELKNAQGILDKNKALFRARVRDLYIRGGISEWELLFGTSYSFAEAAQFAGLKQIVINKNKDLIIQYTSTVKNLENTRAQIADSESVATSQLGQIQALRNAQSAQVSSITKTQSSLNNQVNQINTTLSNLTARQKEIIAAKSGAISSPIGSVPPTGDPNSEKTFDPGFRPAFAVFSFGAYTHRNGMSQYGALGRANSGQTAEQILAAYYPSETIDMNYPVPSTIYINGTNEYGETFNCEPRELNEYLKYLYEVPSSWPTAVLRAQAVAARSYAIRYINTTGNRCNGQPYICPSQSCQVVKKIDINASSWQDAVNDTATWVLTGGVGNFQYSSTSGGYLNTKSSHWDTVSGIRDDWLTGGSYEAIAGSPWFYKGWYKSLYGATCGRSHPWLTQTEFADILNAYIVHTQGTDADRKKVIAIDYSSCFGVSLSDTPYTIDEMRSRAAELLVGEAYTSVSSAPIVSNSNEGYSSSVTVQTNRGTAQFDGQDFRDILNLRLPGRLAAKTSLYNIEAKF